jgi:hypothetical protein
MRAEVVRVDRETLRHFKFPLFLPKGSEEDMLRAARKGVNVGDFIILPDNKGVYRRVRGGFKRVDDADMAELLASQLQTFGGLLLPSKHYWRRSRRQPQVTKK